MWMRSKCWRHKFATNNSQQFNSGQHTCEYCCERIVVTSNLRQIRFAFAGSMNQALGAPLLKHILFLSVYLSSKYRRCDLWRQSKTITWFARIPPGKTFVFWEPDASFCLAKHDVYSVLSTEGGLNVNIGHIIYTACVPCKCTKYLAHQAKSVIMNRLCHHTVTGTHLLLDIHQMEFAQ